MSSFGSYNTSDSTTGQLPLGSNQSVTIGPVQADRAQKVVGSIFADVAGTLLVQQSFDYNSVNGPHWDVSQSITVAAGVPQSFEIDIIAPVMQVVYNNGAAAQATMRLFTRAFTSGS